MLDPYIRGNQNKMKSTAMYNIDCELNIHTTICAKY